MDDDALLWLFFGLAAVGAWLLMVAGRSLPFGQPLVWLGWGVALVAGVMLAVVRIGEMRRK